MSDVLKTLTHHRSIRSYTEHPVSEAQLDGIIRAAQAAPSSINGQQMSIVCVQDQANKARIAELSGGQAWIAQAPVFLLFCADFHRAHLAAQKHGREMVIAASVEALIVGACDVGLAMGNAIAAAEAQGLGIVPIGGVRNQPLALVEMLELPRYVFPICGLVVGHPASFAAIKPRLPRAAVFHREKYQADQQSLIDEYDPVLASFMDRVTNGRITKNWSQSVAEFYDHLYFPEIRTALEHQGFACQ